MPEGHSAIAEVYPALWNRSFDRKGHTPDQHDAFSIAAWLSRADHDGRLAKFLAPNLTPDERALAQVEGWILGVPSSIQDAGRNERDSVRPAAGPPIVREKGRPITKTTQPGYTNKKGQRVVRGTRVPGNDHNQFVYVMRCLKCAHEYGANGSDIWQRRCPMRDGGAPGLGY